MRAKPKRTIAFRLRPNDIASVHGIDTDFQHCSECRGQLLLFFFFPLGFLVFPFQVGECLDRC